jgi:hypothetical protein
MDFFVGDMGVKFGLDGCFLTNDGEGGCGGGGFFKEEEETFSGPNTFTFDDDEDEDEDGAKKSFFDDAII